MRSHCCTCHLRSASLVSSPPQLLSPPSHSLSFLHLYLPDMSRPSSCHQHLHYRSILGHGHFTWSHQTVTMASFLLHFHFSLSLPRLSLKQKEGVRREGPLVLILNQIFRPGSFFSLPKNKSYHLPNILSAPTHRTPGSSVLAPILPRRGSGSHSCTALPLALCVWPGHFLASLNTCMYTHTFKFKHNSSDVI